MMPRTFGYFNHMVITWKIDGNLFFYFNGVQNLISSSFATGLGFDKPGSSKWRIGGNFVVQLSAIRSVITNYNLHECAPSNI